MNYKGFFVVFEGANAAGKSTAMRTVAQTLIAAGHDVVSTREPGGSSLAEHLRALILDPNVEIDAHEQALLLMAGRRNHLRTVIFPALERGAIVLCDRFVASTLVYQTVPRGHEPKLTVEQVVETHRLHCFNMAPDVQLTLTVSNEIAQARKQQRFGEIDRFESEDPTYEQACIDRYQQSGALLGFNQVNIDANGTPEQTVAQIMEYLAPIAERTALTPLAKIDDGNGNSYWCPEPDNRGRAVWIRPDEAGHYAEQASARGDTLRFIPRLSACELPEGYITDVPGCA